MKGEVGRTPQKAGTPKKQTMPADQLVLFDSALAVLLTSQEDPCSSMIWLATLNMPTDNSVLGKSRDRGQLMEAEVKKSLPDQYRYPTSRPI